MITPAAKKIKGEILENGAISFFKKKHIQADGIRSYR
jgi:hypothetical protein